MKSLTYSLFVSKIQYNPNWIFDIFLLSILGFLFGWNLGWVLSFFN